MLPATPTMEGDIQVVLKQHCAGFHLIAMREAAQGDLIGIPIKIRSD